VLKKYNDIFFYQPIRRWENRLHWQIYAQTMVRRGALVVSTLDYRSWGREFKSHRGKELLTSKKDTFESTQHLMSTLAIQLVEKSARERTGHPPSLNRGLWNFGLLTARAPLKPCIIYNATALGYLLTMEQISVYYRN